MTCCRTIVKPCGSQVVAGSDAVLNPGGIAACSRWSSVVCEPTGYCQIRECTPEGYQRWFRTPLEPLPGFTAELIFPVVSQKALHHRLQAAIPPGFKVRHYFFSPQILDPQSRQAPRFGPPERPKTAAAISLR